MREISPAENCSAEEFLERSPASVRAVAQKIRAEKRTGLRLKPSTSLLDESRVLGADKRRFLLDRVTALVDENLFGRAEMCQQFANLLARSLAELGLLARPMMGEATYLDTVGRELFRWQHAWVRIGDEVVDGNVDALRAVTTLAAAAIMRITPDLHRRSSKKSLHTFHKKKSVPHFSISLHIFSKSPICVLIRF